MAVQLTSENSLGLRSSPVFQSRGQRPWYCALSFCPSAAGWLLTLFLSEPFRPSRLCQKVHGVSDITWSLSPGSWVIPRLWGNPRAPSLAAEYVLTWMTLAQTLPEQTASSPEPCVGSGCEQSLAERSQEHSKILYHPRHWVSEF